jgi:hypothetical protein
MFSNLLGGCEDNLWHHHCASLCVAPVLSLSTIILYSYLLSLAVVLDADVVLVVNTALALDLYVLYCGYSPPGWTIC